MSADVSDGVVQVVKVQVPAMPAKLLLDTARRPPGNKERALTQAVDDVADVAPVQGLLGQFLQPALDMFPIAPRGPGEFPQRRDELALAVAPNAAAQPVLPAGTDTGHSPVRAGQAKALRPDLDGAAFFNGQMHAPAHDVASPWLHLQRRGDQRHVEAAVTLVLDDPDMV